MRVENQKPRLKMPFKNSIPAPRACSWGSPAVGRAGSRRIRRWRGRTRPGPATSCWAGPSCPPPRTYPRPTASRGPCRGWGRRLERRPAADTSGGGVHCTGGKKLLSRNFILTKVFSTEMEKNWNICRTVGKRSSPETLCLTKVFSTKIDAN